jgi:ribonuclease P protein component
MSNHSFSRELRIRKAAEFDRIYKARNFAADDVLVVNGDANGLPHARLGLSVSKKVGNAAVRNRWKRLIREAFRLSKDRLPAGVDLVVRPQKGAEPELAAIGSSLVALATRIAKRVLTNKRSRGERPIGERPIGERGASAP